MLISQPHIFADAINPINPSTTKEPIITKPKHVFAYAKRSRTTASSCEKKKKELTFFTKSCNHDNTLKRSSMYTKPDNKYNTNRPNPTYGLLITIIAMTKNSIK